MFEILVYRVIYTLVTIYISRAHLINNTSHENNTKLERETNSTPQTPKMSSFYEHYEFPYDTNQVNHLYDHNYYDNNQHQQFGFDQMSYNNSYDNWNGSEYEYEATTSASVAYSVSTMSEPKHLFYDPSYYTTTTTYESTPQFSIYCNVQGFNEPEFEEYDPTPYGGGYDIVATYGKPLPPSVNTCYPSSTADQGNPPSPPEIIAPVPLGIYDGGGPGGEKKAVKKRVTFSEPLEEAKPLETIQEEENDHQEKEEEEDKEDEEEEEEDHSSSNEEEEEEEDHSSSNGTVKPEAVDKVEVKALYIPSGYGLEATDLCEVIFGGYFPCVSRNRRRQEEDDNRAAEVTCWDSTDSDPWKTTSDYLFGDSYPYGCEDGVGRRQFEISSYGYQSY
ncbi:hypothetical protein HA466_0164880 [Hirschfeldia incana]|nr:hypothetical protein HA466_0164880 [Hirschfeldia incana]